MKKFPAIFLILISFSGLFAQSVSSKNASRRTAERCLKLSENYLLAQDWQSAFSQAEMGLTYDDSISDLYYIEAVCAKETGKPVKDVLTLSEVARSKNNWIGYNEKGNRILLADLFSDTGNLEEALEELDRTPFVFSSDAEAVRIKTYYRLGTDEYVTKAREKINSARRIYKGDIRFINLFYNFELARVLEKGIYVMPDLRTLQIADVLSQELKNYKSLPSETECASIFFTGYTDKEKQLRLLKAFEAENKNDFLFPVAALMNGYWNEEKAFDEFFAFADKNCTLDMLKFFVSLLKNPETYEKLYDYLNAYNGIIYTDTNYDLQWELEVSYERGRPQKIVYDAENDGLEDLACLMDFGELLSVKINPLNIEIFYSDFPYIGRVLAGYASENGLSDYTVFDFAKESVRYSPIQFEKLFENIFSGKENAFYVPEIRASWNDKENLVFLDKATFVRLPVSERENAFVTYSVLDEKVVSAVYTQSNLVYATADFENGIPVRRYVDYNGDNVFETLEIFTLFGENYDGFTNSDKEQIANLFPYYNFSDAIYLSSIQIDADNNNVPEYYEYFREKGGKICLWVKADGHSETYTRFPRNEGEPLVEENAFVVGFNHDTVSVMSVDGIPSSVKVNEMPYKVIKGEMEKFYWIGSEGNGKAEVDLYSKLSPASVENGKVMILEKDDYIYRAIKVAGFIYAQEFVSSEDIAKENADE